MQDLAGHGRIQSAESFRNGKVIDRGTGVLRGDVGGLSGQAFRAMHHMSASRFRKRGKLFNTVFMGEHSHDMGGPYRETFATFVQVSQSDSTQFDGVVLN